MGGKKAAAAAYALASALLYALSIPLSKLLLAEVPPVFLASLLYLGAGAGMGAAGRIRRGRGAPRGEPLARKQLPWVLGMIGLDILAPILLMLGLRTASAAETSLLGNFEILATALFASLLFGEKLSPRLWAGIALVFAGCALLSAEGAAFQGVRPGALLVLGASVCWGLENNCTRMLSGADTARVVELKGLFSGAGSFLVALLAGERFPAWRYVPQVLLLGFAAYGLSLFCYIRAQRGMGAARTSACYASAPFAGALLSLLLLREPLAGTFFPALAVMAAGSILVTADTVLLRHTHLHTHTVTRTHGGVTQTRTFSHCHTHLHWADAPEDHRHFHVGV